LPGAPISAKAYGVNINLRVEMADHRVPATGHPDMDYAEHDKTYAMFVSLTKWVVIASAVLLIFMAYFLL
jgi:hypothetical protein